MSLVGFKGKNHPQQIGRNGARDDVDDRGTPPELFDPIAERFGWFTVDVAAAPHNAKCERFYDRQQDGAAQSWRNERVWCNPPYNAADLARFVAHAWEEWNNGADLIVMLVPANRPEQAWWQDHVEPYRDRPGSPLRVEFLRDRRRFIRHDKGHTEVMPNERPPFGVCLLIWQRGNGRAIAPGSSIDDGSRPSPHGQPPYPETTDVAAHDSERHDLLDPDDPVVLGCVWCQS